MPFAVQDYRTSRVRNRSITTSDPILRALYLELLFALWERGGEIPADPESVADETGLPADEIAPRLKILTKLGETGRGGIVIERGKIRNARVSEDLEESARYRERQSAKGLRSAEVRRGRSATVVEPGLNRGSESVEPPTPTPSPSPSPTPEKKAPRGNPELDWRVERCWQAHLAARDRFFRESDGRPGGRPPALTPEIREAIREAIRRHDGDLMLPLDRDRWESESRALAAGEGIFLSPWHTGRDPQNPKRFLEPWRPWKPQRGKPDPVEGFAELAFASRRRHEPIETRPAALDPFRLAQIAVERARVSGADVADLVARLANVETAEQATKIQQEAEQMRRTA